MSLDQILIGDLQNSEWGDTFATIDRIGSQFNRGIEKGIKGDLIERQVTKHSHGAFRNDAAVATGYDLFHLLSEFRVSVKYQGHSLTLPAGKRNPVRMREIIRNITISNQQSETDDIRGTDFEYLLVLDEFAAVLIPREGLDEFLVKKKGSVQMVGYPVRKAIMLAAHLNRERVAEDPSIRRGYNTWADSV